jgi:hypothetical protein
LLKYFFKNYNTISEERRVAIGKLKDLSKDINEGLKHAERSYKEMAKICAQLHQSTVEFNQDNKNSENEIFEKTFSALQNAFLSIGESKAKESENAKKNLLDLFTNWERELISLDEIVKIRNTVGLDYVAMKTDLKEKKTKLLNAPGAKPEFDKLALKYCCLDKDSEEFNRQKLKFLLPEATKAAHKVAECFGFINSWVYDQVLVYSHARNEKTTELLQDFCKKEIDIIMMRQVAISELKTELEKYVDRNKQLTKFLPKL